MIRLYRPVVLGRGTLNPKTPVRIWVQSNKHKNASLAQRIVRPPSKRKVVGSIPTGGGPK